MTRKAASRQSLSIRATMPSQVRKVSLMKMTVHGNWIKRTTSREVFEKNQVRGESETFFRTLTYF
jgi:hypothetical protein